MDMKITILNLITGLGTGGAERMLYNVLIRLNRQRYRPIVVSMLDVGSMGVLFREKGIKVYTLNMRRGIPTIRALSQVCRIMTYEQPDIVYSHMYHAVILGRIATKLCPVRSRTVSGFRTEKLPSGYIRVILRWSRYLDDFAVVVSESTGKRLSAARLLESERIRVINNGVDPELFCPNPMKRAEVRKQLMIPPAQLVVTAVGRLEYAKDYHTLLKAVSFLRQDSDYKIMIIGDGPLRSDLLSFASELRLLDRVTFLGNRSDIPDLLCASDVFVLSSAWEGMPNSLLEAMAAGLPVIATVVGNVAEIVEPGASGILVSPKSPEMLARGLSALLSMSDRERFEIGQKGRQTVIARYCIANTVLKTQCLFEHAVSLDPCK